MLPDEAQSCRDIARLYPNRITESNARRGAI